LVDLVFLVAFLDFPSWGVISGRSLKYLAGFGGSLREKSEGTADHANFTDRFWLASDRDALQLEVDSGQRRRVVAYLSV
jgi:hypothetical protein